MRSSGNDYSGGPDSPSSRPNNFPNIPNCARYSLSLARGIWIEVRLFVGIPRFTHSQGGEIPIWPDVHRGFPKVLTQVLNRWSTKEPVTVVDLEYLKTRLEYDRVRDHGVVMRVCVLLDIQIFLNFAVIVRKERPLSVQSGTKLIGLQQIIVEMVTILAYPTLSSG